MRFLTGLTVALGLLGSGAVSAYEPPRPLSMGVIDNVIESHDRAVQSCSRSFRGPDARAILLSLEIGTDGTVLTAHPRGQKASSEGQCLAKVARRMKFPRAEAGSKLEYPFVLVPR
jgi:hypothetical protein